MYFCPQCNYSFDITKLSSEIEKDQIDNVNELLKLLRSDGKNFNIDTIKVNFKEEDLLKNSKYKKLSDEQKEMLKQLFIEDTSFEKIEFKCLNCNFRKPINSSIKLYEINLVNDNKSSFKSVQDNKILFNNPIYPRTKDYTCKNMNCITHKNKENKEAVFYKDDQYKLVYICGTCYTNWS